MNYAIVPIGGPTTEAVEYVAAYLAATGQSVEEPAVLGVTIADRQEVSVSPSDVAAGALIEAAGKGYSPGAQRSVSLAAMLRQTHRQALAAAVSPS